MKRTNNYFLSFLAIILFISANIQAQPSNFEETWKEFLETNKVSKVSRIVKPSKKYDAQDYVKYLLINTNNNFCMSEVEKAESMFAEIKQMGSKVYKNIPEFVEKMHTVETKMKSFYSVDKLWKNFLATKEVNIDKLESIKGVKITCEKGTLAKYSYMQAYYYFCSGDFEKAKYLFEKRTLRLVETTSFSTEDVEGLTSSVRDMKAWFKYKPQLDIAWKKYIDSGESSKIDFDLPLFDCNPTPNIKEAILKGAYDVCHLGAKMLEKIDAIKTERDVLLDYEIEEKIEELGWKVDETEANHKALDDAWAAFIPNNKVNHIEYGYSYCDYESLIKAYIMDGFTFACETAKESLQSIDDIRRAHKMRLDKTTIRKIKELKDLAKQYQANGVKIEKVWKDFISFGDTLYQEYEHTDIYCDNIQQVKDWIIQGTIGTCEEKKDNLEKIDDFQKTFEFSFTEEVECRVQNLRMQLWDCQYSMLNDLAKIELDSTTFEERLNGLLLEYEMGDRPEKCVDDH